MDTTLTQIVLLVLSTLFSALAGWLSWLVRQNRLDTKEWREKIGVRMGAIEKDMAVLQSKFDNRASETFEAQNHIDEIEFNMQRLEIELAKLPKRATDF